MTTIKINGHWRIADKQVIDEFFKVCGQRDDWKMLAQSTEARAEQYKSDAIRFETERDAAIDSAEYYKHTHMSMQTTIDELTAQLATAQAERDAGCTWKRRYDKQGYPIYDSTCDIASEQGEVEFSGFNFCPYCGKKIAVVLESKP